MLGGNRAIEDLAAVHVAHFSRVRSAAHRQVFIAIYRTHFVV